MPEHHPFVSEQHMIRYFAKNLSVFEPYLVKCTNSRMGSTEYSIPTFHLESRARIDIMAADCKGGLVIIECKRTLAGHDAVGQVAAYVTALRRHMANVPRLRLRAFIVCRRATTLLWYAISCLNGVTVEVFVYDNDRRVRKLKSPLKRQRKLAP